MAGIPDLEVVIVNYNGATTLQRTIDGLRSAGVASEQIIVSDDGSTDGSADAAERATPGLRVVRLAHNQGNINKVRNAGLARVTAKYVFLTDNDIIVGDGTLERLILLLEERPGTVLVTPRLLEFTRPEEIFYDGNYIHFLGLSGVPGRGLPSSFMPASPVRPTAGGGIMMFNTQLGRRIGWMDEGYRMGWGNDAEVQFRARAFGYEALHDSRVAMLHFGKNHGSKRAFGQMTNRYRFLLTYYSRSTLLMLLPSLLMFEILLTAFSFAMGVSGPRIEAIKHTVRVRSELRAKRAEIRSRRRRSDTELLSGGEFELPGIARGRPVLRWLAAVARSPFELNWRILLGLSRVLAGRKRS